MPRKHRKRDQTSHWFNTIFNEDGTVSSSSSGSAVDPIEDSLIEYLTGSHRFNPCKHVAIKATCPGYNGTLFQKKSSGVGYFARQQATNWTVGSFGTPGPELLWRADTGPHPWAPAGFLGRGYEAMWPKLNSEANVVNFLIELRDFRRMFSSAVNSFKMAMAGRLVSSAAEANLNWSFGIKPFWSDIMNLQRSYSDFTRRINETNSSQGRKVHHYTEKVGHPADTVTWYWSATHSRLVHRAEYEVVANLTVSYEMKLAIPLVPTLGAYLKSVGIRPSLKTVWDAIPFSFLVDWFLKVGDWLASFDERVPVDIVIHDACWSSKTLEKARVEWVAGSPLANPNWQPTMAQWGNYSRKVYIRERLYPSDLAKAPNLPRLDNIGVRELVLALSLLIRSGRN